MMPNNIDQFKEAPYTDKKENKIFLIYKEIKMDRVPLVIYD